MTKMDESYHKQLHSKIFAALRVAEWIFYDYALDCDGGAPERTQERLQNVHTANGAAALFGVASCWCMHAKIELQEGYKRKGLLKPVEISPPNVSEITNYDADEQRKRTMISAQQFAAAVSRDDLELAEDIFNAAYTTSLDEALDMMYAVLSISAFISNSAQQMR